MRLNHTRDRLLRGDTVFGCAMQFYRSTEIPRAFAAAGFDYIFVDLEHGGFDLETAQDIIAASVDAGLTPLVRVSELMYSLIARVLDVGAQGIILPRVECPSTLEEAISWTKYPPEGKRGFGFLAPLLDYERRSVAEIMEHLNQTTLVVVQFETRAAMERCDELLAVKGMDVALVGPTDLSISLGIPGEFEHPLLVDTVLHFIEKCTQHGVVPGIQCRNVAQARFWAQRGIRLVGAGSEQSLLLEKCSEAVKELRSSVTLSGVTTEKR